MPTDNPLPADHPPVLTGKIGVLVVNLGTPDAPTPSAVRRYLKQFLSDRRVVEIPRVVWWPILNGIVLNTRPKKSAHAYSLVWTEQGSHSPQSPRRRLQLCRPGWAMRSWSTMPCVMAIPRSGQRFSG